MGVLNQAFDVLVLRYGVQKRIYCNVSMQGPPRPELGTSGQAKASCRVWNYVNFEVGPRAIRFLCPPC